MATGQLPVEALPLTKLDKRVDSFSTFEEVRIFSSALSKIDRKVCNSDLLI